jgi:hypothetical protein
MKSMTAKEIALNEATLTYSMVQEIGNDAHDAWVAMLAMYELCHPRILPGYTFEAQKAFSVFFA